MGASFKLLNVIMSPQLLTRFSETKTTLQNSCRTRGGSGVLLETPPPPSLPAVFKYPMTMKEFGNKDQIISFSWDI